MLPGLAIMFGNVMFDYMNAWCDWSYLPSSATKGLKTKNPKSSKGGGGFVSSLKRAPSDVNLSEESSDESSEKINAKDEFEISDEILASIDLASCIQSEISTIINNGTSTTGKKATTKSGKVKKPRKSKLCWRIFEICILFSLFLALPNKARWHILGT